MSADAIFAVVAIPLIFAWTAWRIVVFRRRARLLRELTRLIAESKRESGE
jgi:hypothetical protein